MIRIFHPIGQGAFYSERHDGYNIVYDCGEWKKSKKSTELVKNSFKPGSTIDILFISHFDYDHVSQIYTLKKHFHIKNCVLPFINNDEHKKLLVAFYRCLKCTSVINLIENPRTFFGEETKIIYVDEGQKEEEKNSEKVVDLENVQSGTHIESGDIISIGEWLYIPYNKKYSERHAELMNEIQSKGIDIDKLKNDICSDITKIIRDVYNRLAGGINANSMMVYSGPIDKSLYHIKRLYYGLSQVDCKRCLLFKEIFETAGGCIFTGDSNLEDVLPLYLKYQDSIGTIQLPHHGSAKSFDFNFLRNKNECLYLPASYGTKNPYGHPSQNVIYNIVKNGSCFVHITEHAYTTFIQYIEH